MVSLTKVWLLAATRLRRSWRAAAGTRAKNAVLAVPALFGIVYVVGRLPVAGYDRIWTEPGAYAYGRMVADGVDASAPSAARVLSGVLFVMVVYLVVMRSVSAGERAAPAVPLYRTVVRPETAAGAELAHQTAIVGLGAAPVIGAGAGAYAVGVGDPLAGGPAVVAGGLLVVGAVTVAVPIATLAKLAFARVPAIRRRRRTLGGLVVVGFAAFYVTVRWTAAPIGQSPIGWYGDLAVVTTAPDAAPAKAATVFVATLVALPVSVVVSGRIFRRLWFTSEVPVETTSTDERTAAGAIVDRGVPAVGRPAAGVAVTVWRRVFRRPNALVYSVALAPILFVAASTTASTLSVPAPFLAAAYGATIVGTTHVLNPIGTEGAGLAVVMTTPGGANRLLHGYALSAALPGAAVVTGVVVAVGGITGTAPWVIALAAGLGVVLSVATVCLGLAIGVLLPEYEGPSPFDSDGPQSPRTGALTALLFVGPVLAVPALFAARIVGDLSAEPGTVGLMIGGTGLTAFVAVGVSWLALRVARTRLCRVDPTGRS